MKRALVEYDSSDDDEQEQKKKKLPPLPPSLVPPAPRDNPALHQGRVRAVPHAEGQYAAYVYVPLVLHPTDALHVLLDRALAAAAAQVPTLRVIGRQDAQWELHVSLSRPLFLRAHQREEFKRSIKQVASSVAPFDASFATFSELPNDERTRSFLAIEVGAGHAQFCRCLDLLAPALRSLRQKEFYADPRFHASIAWALLENPSSSACTAPEDSSDTFRCIPHFPQNLVPSLNKTFATTLSQAQTSGFIADSISVKIGKDIFTWSLDGIK